MQHQLETAIKRSNDLKEMINSCKSVLARKYVQFPTGPYDELGGNPRTAAPFLFFNEAAPTNNSLLALVDERVNIRKKITEMKEERAELKTFIENERNAIKSPLKTCQPKR